MQVGRGCSAGERLEMQVGLSDVQKAYPMDQSWSGLACCNARARLVRRWPFVGSRRGPRRAGTCLGASCSRGHAWELRAGAVHGVKTGYRWYRLVICWAGLLAGDARNKESHAWLTRLLPTRKGEHHTMHGRAHVKEFQFGPCKVTAAW